MLKIDRETLKLTLSAAALMVAVSAPITLLAVEGESQLMGELTKIDGDRYTVHGDQGEDVTVRVTKDTNIICARVL